MKKTVTYLAFILLCACTRQEPAPNTTNAVCGVNDPAQNLPWLRQQIMDSGIDVVTTATYQNKTYINLYAYHWSCTTCRLYMCDGTQIEFFKLSPADQQELNKLLFSPSAQVIYKRKQ